MTCFIGLEITELAEKDMPIGKKKTPDYYLLRFKNWFIAFCFTRGFEMTELIGDDMPVV